MATWIEFETDAPDIAAAGRQMLYQFGVGLAFLATLRKDGAPRLHPVCPTIVDGHLYALIGPTPKRADLMRDGRYALHTFPPVDVDDEFLVMGRATFIDSEEITDKVRADLVVYVRATIEVLAERLRKRNRDFERHISFDYLERVSSAYRDFFFYYDEAPLLVVDTSDIDFVANPDDLRELIREIDRAGPGTQYFVPRKN